MTSGQVDGRQRVSHTETQRVILEHRYRTELPFPISTGFYQYSCSRNAVLRAYRSYAGLFDDWYYWSPAAARNTEVDFLLRRDGRFVAIEVKSRDSFTDRDARGLRAIADLPGVARRVLVFTGERGGVLDDGIEVLPIARFLDEVSGGSLFP